jgi:DNA polymerase III subunit delta
MIYKSYILEEDIKKISDIGSILFFGENIGLKNDFKNKIKSFKSNSSILNIDQDDIIKNHNLLLNEIENFSLFEKNKIIFINNSNDKIFPILENVSENLTQINLILFSNILEKKSKLRNFYEKSKKLISVACYPDNEITIKKIINTKLKGYAGLSPFNINLIANNVNLDRAKLNNELEKITTFFQNKNIETDKLEVLLDISSNDDFNILKDHALNGNKIKTNKLLSDTNIDPDKNIFYLSLMNQRLNMLLSATQISKKGSIENRVNNIKPPIFWKDKPNFITQTKKWNESKIKLFLSKTYNLELQLKSNSVINRQTLIKKIIVEACEMANV